MFIALQRTPKKIRFMMKMNESEIYNCQSKFLYKDSTIEVFLQRIFNLVIVIKQLKIKENTTKN